VVSLGFLHYVLEASEAGRSTVDGMSPTAVPICTFGTVSSAVRGATQNFREFEYTA
jgi:hypothetical protein